VQSSGDGADEIKMMRFLRLMPVLCALTPQSLSVDLFIKFAFVIRVSVCLLLLLDFSRVVAMYLYIGMLF